MKNVVIMVGIAGSGKSTIATRLDGHTVISMDDLRKIGGRACARIAERMAGRQDRMLSVWRRAENVLIEEAMSRGEDIVIDDTNLEQKIRAMHIQRAKRHGYRIRCIFVDRPRLAHVQNLSRERVVPDGALYRQQARLERPAMGEGFDSLRVLFEPAGA